jgi:hypothetical protein
MSIVNGAPANATSFNDAFVSKTTASTVTGTITLNNGLTSQIDDIQEAINTASGDITTAEGRLDALEALETVATHVADTTPHATISAASIEIPTKLDFKQDTEANLIVYAGSSGANGEATFATDTKKYYGIVDGALTAFGGGSGGGIGDASTYKLLNSDSDDSTWLTGQGTFLSGGTITGVFTKQDTVNVLNGDSSYSLTNAAVNDYIASAVIDVPLRSRGQTNKCKFPFLYNGNDGDMQVIVYDVTNAATLFSVTLKASAGDKKQELLFDVPSTCTQVQVGFQTVVLNSGKLLVFDDLELTDNAFGMVSTSVDTDWESFTPIINWGITAVTAYKRRNGSNEEYDIKVNLSGTSISGNFQFTIPESKVIDTTKTPDTRSTLGVASLYDVSTGARSVATVKINTNTTVILQGTAEVSATAPWTWVATDTISMRFSVPIAGWRASRDNVLLEGEGMKRVAVYAAGNAEQAITADVTDIPFIEVEDTDGLWNGSQFTAKEDGDYSIVGQTYYTVATVRNTYLYNITDATTLKYLGNTSPAATVAGFAGTIHLKKGKQYSIRHDVGGTLLNAAFHNLSIVKLATIDKPIYAVPVSKENVFSAKISSAGAISSQNADWVNSVVLSSTSIYTINITKLGLSNAPSVIAETIHDITLGSTTARVANVSSVTATEIVVKTYYQDAAGAAIASAYPFSIKIQKQGSDYTPQGVMIAGSVARERVAYVRVNSGNTQYATVAATTSYKTIPLVSVEGDSDIVSISSNQATLQAGEYEIEIPVAGYANTGWIDVLIYNVTASANLKEMTFVTANDGVNCTAFNSARTKIYLSSATTIRFDKKSGATGGAEFASTIKIRKLLGND